MKRKHKQLCKTENSPAFWLTYKHLQICICTLESWLHSFYHCFLKTSLQFNLQNCYKLTDNKYCCQIKYNIYLKECLLQDFSSWNSLMTTCSCFWPDRPAMQPSNQKEKESQKKCTSISGSQALMSVYSLIQMTTRKLSH